MIDPRVASGLRDLTPAGDDPPRADARDLPPGLRQIRLPANRNAPHRADGSLDRQGSRLRRGTPPDLRGHQQGRHSRRAGPSFDLTVPLARFVARHIDELGIPFKRYAIGSVFRGERPAKGRFREFVQCDFDTIGTESALADAETAQVIHAALAAAGVPDFTITLNNRKILDGFLQSLDLSARSGPVLRSLDKLAKIGREASSPS